MTTQVQFRCLLIAVLWFAGTVPALAETPATASLFKAADVGDVVGLKRQLAAGLDVNAADPDGWTALMVAASAGRLPVVQALLKAGADVNARSKQGETPLMAAVLSGNAAIVKLLLSGGADKAAASAQGLTAADVAIRAKHPELAKLLQPAQVAKAVATPPPVANPKKVEAKVDAAASAFQSGRYTEATALFREVVTVDPQHALAWHFLGQSLEQTGDLIGARKAYGQSLAAQSQGQVADRTRQMLAKLPLPDPARIALPSGLTLLDWMNTANRRLPAESDAVLAEASAYIDQYGPYPQLTQLQDQILKDEFAALKVDSADAARASLPQIVRLMKMAPGNERLILLEATALHMTGDFAGAQKAYAAWLGSVPTGHPRRIIVATNIQRAQHGEGPLKPKTRPQLPFQLSEEVWKVIEESEVYAFAPDVKNVTVDYTQVSQFRGGGTDFDTKKLSTKSIKALGSGAFFSERRETDDKGFTTILTTYSVESLPLGTFYRAPRGYESGSLLIRVNQLSGSLFPLRIGANISYDYTTRDRDGAEHRTRGACKIVQQFPAATLYEKLTGSAWANECSGSYDSDAPRTSTSFYIENLGVVDAHLKVVGEHGLVFPTPGYSYTNTQNNGTRVTTTYSNYNLRF